MPGTCVRTAARILVEVSGRDSPAGHLAAYKDDRHKIPYDRPDLLLGADVDLTEARQVADRAFAAEPLDGGELRMLLRELQGWYEDWIVSEQEQFPLQRVQALEALCRTATHGGAYRGATAAGLAAVCAGPLRKFCGHCARRGPPVRGQLRGPVRRYQADETLLRYKLHAAPGR